MLCFMLVGVPFLEHDKINTFISTSLAHKGNLL